MYKRTIWQDHVEGIQEGTDMNASNFNNIEAGIMEANALASLNAEYRRYSNDVAKNCEVVIVEATLTGTNTPHSIAIPGHATRNSENYNVVPELSTINEGTAGDIIILSKQANGFTAIYNGSAKSIVVRFHISGGMI